MKISLFVALRALSGLTLALTAAAQSERPIQDNSFLLEEAYNQEPGVVQHISTLSRMWNSKDFVYTFTQEWPGIRHPKRQFSYTLAMAHLGDYPGTGVGLGDVALHYRYQVAGDGDSRFAFAPRASLLLPTGSVAQGRGSGSFGMQTNLPVSVVLSRWVVTHWNAGGTILPSARGTLGGRAASLGYNSGAGMVFLANARLNVMLEVARNCYQEVVGAGRTEWSRTTYVSPGIRWAHNLRHGMQIVPGVAVPMGIWGSGGERGVFLYLSVEHPFRGER